MPLDQCRLHRSHLSQCSVLGKRAGPLKEGDEDIPEPQTPPITLYADSWKGASGMATVVGWHGVESSMDPL